MSESSALSIRTIKANPELSAYFGKLSLSELAESAYSKGASLETYAGALAGALFEYVSTGSNHGLSFLRAEAASEKKGTRATRARVALAFAEGHKAGKTPLTTLEDAEVALAGFHAEFLAILTPESSTPKAKPINWKQECMNARAERDALAEELTTARKAMDALSDKLATARALAVQAPAPTENTSA